MLKSQIQSLLLALSLTAGTASIVVPTTYAEDVRVPTTVEDHLALAKSKSSIASSKLAADATKAAEYRSLRAEELQGK